MSKKAVSGIMLTMLLIGMLTLTFNLTVAEVNDIESIELVRATDAIATEAVDWWPMFQHDPRHTGYSTSLAPRTNRTEWNSTLFAIPGYKAMEVTGLAISDGMVYVGTWVAVGPTMVMPSPVFALNLTTGEEIWSFTLPDGVYWSPAVAEGLVFATSHFTKDGVYALNQTTGSQVWKWWRADTEIFRPLTVADGILFLCTQISGVFALNTTTGVEIWHWAGHEGGLNTSPAVYDDIVFVGADGTDRNVYALNKTTGDKIWNYTTGGSICASLSVADGVVFVGSAENKVYALNSTTGQKIWSRSLAGRPYRIVNANNHIFVTSDDGKATALSAASGSMYWTKTISTGWPGFTPIIVADGKVFVGARYDGLFALDASSGSTIWRAQGYFKDVVIADNKLLSHNYLGAEANQVVVYCFTDAHDVAVTNVTPDKTTAIQGQEVRIEVIAENQGSYTETFNVTTYVNITQIGKETIINLNPGVKKILIFVWNTTGFAIGNYTISANATILPNETDTADNSYIDGTVTVRPPIYDIAVKDVAPSKTIVGQGYSMSINVTVENQGDFTESFNVSVFYDDTVITLPDGKNHTTTILSSGNSTAVTFTWNTTGVAKGNYTITAKATIVPYETDTTDNTLTDGTVLVTIKGDVNGDLIVEISDLVLVIRQWLTYQGGPDWNPNMDINGDNIVDISDLVLVIKYYGTAAVVEKM